MLNILHNIWRSGGRKGQNRHLAEAVLQEQVAYASDTQIGRSEIVAPLRDAVCFVHGDHAYRQFQEAFAEGFALQAFGRDVEEMVGTELTVVEGYALLVVRHTGVDGSGVDAPFTQILDLVLHQGDEGCDYEAQASLIGQCVTHDEGGYLKA